MSEVGGSRFVCVKERNYAVTLLCQSMWHVVGTQWHKQLVTEWNNIREPGAACQLLPIFDLVSLLGQGKKKVLFWPVAGQLGLFTPVVSQIPKQCDIARNYTSGRPGAFLLLTLLAGSPLQLPVCPLLWSLAVTEPLHASSPGDLSGTTSMLGNWLSSSPALWVILSCALVRSIFSMAFQ